MTITVRKGNLIDEKADLLVLNRFAGEKTGGAYAAVNERLEGLLDTVAKEEGFKAALGSTLLVRTVGQIPARRVLVVGLGDQKKFSEEAVRVAAAVSLNAAKAMGAKTVASVLHGAGGGALDAKTCGKAMAEGIRLADYDFGRYKKEAAKKSPSTFSILTTDGKKARSAADGAALGERYARATVFARDLVNTPGQHMRPVDLVEAAKAVAKGKGSIRVKVYGKDQLERMGAGGMLGVNQGSDHEPFLVHMVFRPKAARPRGREAKRVCLVGKAVTFDSGGLSLKPAGGMETMKCDMAGAAAVIGAFSVIDELSPALEVHGIFGAVENMPSGKAIRPGDVVTIMNGKTIEIKNTDAEGRLILADALDYTQDLGPHKPDIIIDAATLTGAVSVALGKQCCAALGNDDKLFEAVRDAGSDCGERIWQLPLYDEYFEDMKSDAADMKNSCNDANGGTIRGAIFLKQFIRPKTRWVHLDIAAMAYGAAHIDYHPKRGASGMYVRTLARLAETYGQDQKTRGVKNDA